eukprot:g25572.t1
MVGAWNTLPEEVVETRMLATFKRCLDGYMNRGGLEGSRPNKGRSINYFVNDFANDFEKAIQTVMSWVRCVLIFIDETCLSLSSHGNGHGFANAVL